MSPRNKRHLKIAAIILPGWILALAAVLSYFQPVGTVLALRCKSDQPP